MKNARTDKPTVLVPAKPKRPIGHDDVVWGSLGFPMLVAGAFFGIDLWLQSPTLISFPLNLLGVPLIALGLSLTSWSFKTILAIPRNAVLVTSGPWAHVRHPIYLTGFIVGLGYAIIIGTATMFVGFAVHLLLDVFASGAKVAPENQKQRSIAR